MSDGRAVPGGDLVGSEAVSIGFEAAAGTGADSSASAVPGRKVLDPTAVLANPSAKAPTEPRLAIGPASVAGFGISSKRLSPTTTAPAASAMTNVFEGKYANGFSDGGGSVVIAACDMWRTEPSAGDALLNEADAPSTVRSSPAVSGAVL